jgi:hypothetical protein
MRNNVANVWLQQVAIMGNVQKLIPQMKTLQKCPEHVRVTMATPDHYVIGCSARIQMTL